MTSPGPGDSLGRSPLSPATDTEHEGEHHDDNVMIVSGLGSEARDNITNTGLHEVTVSKQRHPRSSTPSKEYIGDSGMIIILFHYLDLTKSFPFS